MKTSRRAFWTILTVVVGLLARAAAAEPFFFIQLSDTQLGMFADNANFAQDAANFEFAVANVNRLRPAFVIITGDLVNKPGDSAQIAEYRRIAARIDPAIPVYHLAGNHDVGKPLGGARSGFRIAIVREDRIDHRFYELGEIPNRIDPSAPLPPPPAPAKK